MGNTVGRLQSLFSPHQLDVIVGSLLGDGGLECRSKEIRVFPITARLRIQHGDKQKDYVFWKYQILKSFVSKGPRKIMVWYDRKRNKKHYSWYFHTRSSEKFGLLHQYFYQEKKKIFPENISGLITPRVLAVWFMDDGSNTKESFTLNTHCFSQKEQLRIIKFLKEYYKVSPTLIKDRMKWKIRIGKNDYQRFIDIIKPFIIPSMIYKIVNPPNDFASFF
jgi:hypothetical protein